MSVEVLAGSAWNGLARLVRISVGRACAIRVLPHGTGLDEHGADCRWDPCWELAVGAGWLACGGLLDPADLRDVLLAGRVDGAGRLLGFPGAQELVHQAARSGVTRVVLPAETLHAVRRQAGLELLAAEHLLDVPRLLAQPRGDRNPQAPASPTARAAVHVIRRRAA